ncbi:MAG: glutamine synthetase III [Clostridia bacterium]|nr:glutamine synthetase III [Clostridia bacterium]
MSIPEKFGSMVFGDAEMRRRLSAEIYAEMKNCVELGMPLTPSAADVIASAMRDWAVEHGATHYTHWFQPMTGITAEKHDSFISPTGDGGVVMDFSGKQLIKGESDASSFPSGGLRATFEARGYTAWDPTSYAFIKDKVLCIPTAFCSYGGEALDKKTPLLRSMEAIDKQALRILRLFGSDVKKVTTTVGPEQEYFLIDRSLYEKREDLIFTGRTLFGAKPPKGQELDDHYYGSIKPRVQAFMDELNDELWSLGVLAKTEHNEAAPSQHELAPIYTTTNIATDHNQITMEVMKNIAKKHDLVCILHEKPFEGVNGSGKHNNWSLSTDTGVNLLEPGDTPQDNAQFLLILCAVIKAVDDYQDMLRVSVATPANDHRLGADEAPPAIVSMFLGDELESILDSIENGSAYDAKKEQMMRIGVDFLPKFPRDNTDRNRTSPFAFTGNKFEFRMVGSSQSIAGANVVINTAVAESFAQFADELEGADDFVAALNALIRSTIKEHKRILFNGNAYSSEWEQEAKRRGLSNFKTVPDAMPGYIAPKNIATFTRHGVFTEAEMHARYEIHLQDYSKVLTIEALTMTEMVKKKILPAISAFTADISRAASDKTAFLAVADTSYERKTVGELSALSGKIYALVGTLSADLDKVGKIADSYERARAFCDIVVPEMDELRRCVDSAEEVTSADYWPYPSYGDLLFGVN